MQTRKSTKVDKIGTKKERQARKGTNAGKERHKGRQGMAHLQAWKGKRAGKERHKGRQGNTQKKAGRQARIGTKVGEEKYKCRQVNAKENTRFEFQANTKL